MNERKKKQAFIIIVLAVALSFGLPMLLRRNMTGPGNTATQFDAKVARPKNTPAQSEVKADLLKKREMVSHKKSVKLKRSTAAFNIDGYVIGMSLDQVKLLLKRRNIKRYETGFSDLFVYDPAPDFEIKLQFACGEKGGVLGRVDYSTVFTTDETGTAASKFTEKLTAKYGVPPIVDSQRDLSDACWGQCEQGADGTKLTTRTTPLQDDKMSATLELSNDELFRQCSEMRPKKINGFLYQWIASVQKFKLGMLLKDASTLYQKCHHDKMVVEMERDEASQQYAVTDYVVKDYDFFTPLDFESQAFEGDGPGTVVLKFTGGQAGKGSLNRRLYYASFSTTKFTDKHTYGDMKEKLDKFVKTYGIPAEVVQQPDLVAARWQQDTKQRSVNISDSGLITFEESDQALKDAYRDAAVKTIEEYSKTRFDRPLF